METPANTQVVCSVTLDPRQLRDAARVCEHVKTHLRKGIIEVALTPVPRLSFFASFGAKAIITCKLRDAVLSHRTEEGTKAAYTFRNSSYGDSFVHTRELFSPKLARANITFYKRLRAGDPEFVRSAFEYNDCVTETRHQALAENLLPLDQTLAPAVPDINSNDLILSTKTTQAVQRWMRETLKAQPTADVIRITVNPTLAVMVMTLGVASKTLTFTPVEGDLQTCVIKSDRQRDWGVFTVETESLVSTTSLLQALGACRIPGTFLPCISVYGSKVEVKGVCVKKGINCPVDLSVLLLKASPEAVSCPATSPSSTLTKGASECHIYARTFEQVTYLPEAVNSAVSASCSSCPLPVVKAASHPISDSNSSSEDEFNTEKNVAVLPVPVAQKRRADPRKLPVAKKPRPSASFNPLI